MTATGGWAVTNGDFATVAGSAAVPQGVKIRTQMVLSECYLDESIGVDWFGRILVKNPNPLEVRAEIASEAAETPDVTDVVAAALQGPDANRRASLAMQIATVYSQTPVGVTAQVP